MMREIVFRGVPKNKDYFFRIPPEYYKYHNASNLIFIYGSLLKKMKKLLYVGIIKMYIGKQKLYQKRLVNILVIKIFIRIIFLRATLCPVNLMITSNILEKLSSENLETI